MSLHKSYKRPRRACTSQSLHTKGSGSGKMRVLEEPHNAVLGPHMILLLLLRGGRRVQVSGRRDQRLRLPPGLHRALQQEGLCLRRLLSLRVPTTAHGTVFTMQKCARLKCTTCS